MIMIGIDPHKANHTAVAVDDHGVMLGELTVRASAVQAERLCRWAAGGTSTSTVRDRDIEWVGWS